MSAQKRYRQYKKQIRRTPSRNKSYVGYCHNPKHKGHLTVELLSEHNCVENDCFYFEIKKHNLWRDPKYTTRKVSSKKLKRIRTIISNSEDHPHFHRQLEKFKEDSDTNP